MGAASVDLANVSNANFTAKASAAGIGGGKRYATLLVGTSTSGHTADKVDYLCDGTADDIEVEERDSMEQAEEIWQMGEAAYLEMVNALTMDDYLIDLDYRISKMELGILWKGDFMMTYTYCKKIITSGKYEKMDMLDKLDVFLLKDRITQEQYNELVATL